MYIIKGINVSCRTINGISYIFDQQSRMLLKFEEVGSFIWDQISGKVTLEDIVEKCCEQYEGDQDEIAEAVREFLAELLDQNVISQNISPFPEEMTSAC